MTTHRSEAAARRAGRRTTPAVAGRPALDPIHPLLQLQRTHGNRYVQRLLVQAKLAVGRADDPCERDADAVAARVVRRLAPPEVGPSSVPTSAPAAGEDRPTADAPEPEIRRTPIGTDGGELDQDVDRMLSSSRSARRPLPDRVRSQMEGVFGVDLGDVGVHTGPTARELNERIGARAFTSGRDIYFRDGLPGTTTRSGLELLAHELTHVVQQRGRDADRPQDIRRMTIKGLGKTKVKDNYKPGDLPRFKEDFARLKEDQIREAGGNLEKALLKLAKIDNAKDFGLLFDVLAGSDAEYADLDEFLAEMGTLRRDWGGQKVFYEKPSGAKKASVLPDVKWQEGRTVRLYSAREAQHIQDLYVWARQNGITTEGFDQYADLPDTKAVTAPLHGHFADRAHTVKYARQKKAKGGGLVCIVLTENASEQLRKAKEDPSNIAMQGGEGGVAGGFGFKLENSFVSLAVGQTAKTWNFLKDKIDRIILQDVGSTTGGSSQAKERATKAPSSEPGVKGPAESEGDVLPFATWAEASHTYLEEGALIRIMHNEAGDISDRIFVVKKTYDPSRMEHPDIHGYVKWLS